MSSADRPAAGTHLFYLDDAGVLFCEATQELHLLNTAATAIWSLLEEGHDAASAAAELQRLYDLDAATSAQFVAVALDEWRGRSLLEGSVGVPPAKPPDPAVALAARALPAWRESPAVEERHYRLLGAVFRLRYSSVAQVQMVHPVIAHLAIPDAPSPTFVFDFIEIAGRLIVYRNREALDACTGVIGLAPIVKSLLWVNAVNNFRYFLDIHAGVIGDGTRCAIFPAKPGSGKSTLTAALMHAGFEFFSDEVALLEEGTLGVFPVPLAICVKSTGVAALAERFPLLRELQVHHRADGKLVSYMPPPPECCPDGDHSRPVAALIFPRYVQDAATELVPLGAGVALKQLLDECMAVPVRLDEQRVAALVEWIARIPCRSLTYGSTNEAIAAVRSVLAASPVATAS